MKGKQDKRPRRPYRRPRVERVELRLEETVLGACKNPGTQQCTPPGHDPARLPGS